MKKNFKYAFMSAIAFAGAVGFSACQSSDEIVDNPDYNPETNTVKAEFAISLPNYVGKSAKTRQEAGVAQVAEASDFRGITDAYLIPYEELITNSNTDNTAFKSTVFDITPFSNFSETNDQATQNAKVYTTLDIAVGTKAFMFFGKAMEQTPTPTYPDDVTTDEQKAVYNKFYYGFLNAPTEATYEGEANGIGFSLQSIYSGSIASDEKAQAILAYIQRIREARTDVTINATLHAYLESFKPIAGSSASIQAAVQKLWDYAKGCDDDADGRTAVRNAITTFNSTAYASIDANDKVTLTHPNLTGFPANLNLPDGAVAISWLASDGNPAWATQAFGATNIPTLDNYVYPASLYYRANTQIGVSDTKNQSKNYGSSEWFDTNFQTLYTWNEAVQASTRSIALENQIKYAVGRLDLKIKADGDEGKLYDRNGDAVVIPTAGFPVSAVLVGSQNNVDYKFEPTSSTGYTIYDKIMNSPTMVAKDGVYSAVNHTLVLETSTTATEIYVAVELTNKSGIAFAGADGTVPVDGKFYLIGKLDLSEATGSRIKIFEQDYITEANLTITHGTASSDNANGLGNAYNVIPDLKDAELEVAFSVNLNWIEGLKFNVNI